MNEDFDFTAKDGIEFTLWMLIAAFCGIGMAMIFLSCR